MTESKKDTQSCVRHEWELLLHIWDWEWEMAKPIPSFWDWEREYKIKFPTFGIRNGNDKSNSQLLGLGMGMKTKFPTFGNGKWHLISQKVGNAIRNPEIPLSCLALC